VSTVVANSSRLRTSAGFTLVEVLVALSILSMLSLMSFMGINALIAAEAQMRESSTRLRAIERVLAEFENDVLFATPRQAWNASGTQEAALSGRPRPPAGYRISFSHFSNLPETPPYRVSYLFAPPNIELAVHAQLDSAGGSETPPIKVLEGLRAAAVRFLGADDRWSDSWPPSGAVATSLPRAVELTLDIDGLGSITRLVARP